MNNKWVNSYIRQIPVRDRGKEPEGLIHLDHNEASFPPSPVVVEAIRAAAPTVNRYPDTGAHALAEATAEYTGCARESLVFGNGSDEIIELLSRTLLANGDEIIVPIPSFFYYSTAARAVGGRVVGVPRNDDFTINVEKIVKAVTGRTKIVYIANPNNPTGTPEQAETIDLLLAQRIPALVVIDECYFEYSGLTVLDRLGHYDNLFVMRSFSKAFGLAGLRVGYGIGSPELCHLLYQSAQSYSVNRIAQAAARAALEDLDYSRRQIACVCQERERLDAALRQRNLKTYASAANFLLVDVSASSLTSSVLTRSLQGQGIAIADFSGAPGLGEYFVRITIGTPHENGRLLEALDQVLQHRPAHA